MKKIFTLLFCSIIVTAAFAQNDRRSWNNGNAGYGYNDRGTGHNQFDNNRDREFKVNENRSAYVSRQAFDRFQERNRIFFPVRVVRQPVSVYFTYQNYRYGIDQRDVIVSRITTYYDEQIQQVLNDESMNDWQRRQAVNELQNEKAAEINNIYSQCGDAVPDNAQY